MKVIAKLSLAMPSPVSKASHWRGKAGRLRYTPCGLLVAVDIPLYPHGGDHDMHLVLDDRERYAVIMRYVPALQGH